MTRKQFKLLAQGSYTRGKLDVKKVKQIAKLLKPSQLRQYVKELKKIEEKKVIRVVVPNKEMISKNNILLIKSAYPKKTVLIEEDPKLILGIKLIDNDLIYDLNLRNNLENINEFIIDRYDK
ncbi:MAG: hypothetical protein A2W22_03940 [Candidatus Levybacteria bacterium RBG_16_35_11]|nr:MAG: hypothetical protein A2W22_03940 [Candidatus Levybacteria bacterium RBG_16_35_11]